MNTRMLAILLVATLLPGCAVLHLGKHTPEVEPPASKIVPVSGRSVDAHVCPISPVQALTAWHVAYEVNYFTWEQRAIPMVFVGAGGTPGTLLAEINDKRKDIAIVATYGASFEGWYKIAEKIPEVGDRVRISGFDITTGFTTYWWESVVLEPNIAGQLRYAGSPMGGSSGSCVLNDDDEIVAINVSYFHWRDGLEDTFVGNGWLVAGPWFQMPLNFVEITDPTYEGVEIPKE